MIRSLILGTLLMLSVTIPAQAQSSPPFTHADTLRGSITPQRAWWDVTFYDLNVAIHPSDSTIAGWNAITYEVTKQPKEMQIDLQPPLHIDSVKQAGRSLDYRRDGNAYFVTMQSPQPQGAHKTVTVYYSGHPHIAENPPWSGGFTWGRDKEGNPWIVTTCQGVGASIWWPNKDHQSEEPDSMAINMTVPDPLIDVSNGRLRKRTHHDNGTTTYSWFVNNPINNYTVAVNVGHYSHFSGTYQGKKGPLDLNYWVLEYNLQKAKSYLTKEVREMLDAFEYWFGPYPFYEDGYKIVDVPNTGMEHQSAIAYGNRYAHGYRGRDGSGSGWGLKFDFIVVHESAHEWWGNNITSNDIADMWVHESFANYSENLYVEYRFGKEAGGEFVRGTRGGIENEHAIIPHYNVNEKGPGDMYSKGGNMLHTIRHVINDDAKWRQILTGANQKFRHQTIDGTQLIAYFDRQSDKELTQIFDQYLRYPDIPVFEYHIEGGTLYYRWDADVENFDMPVKVTLDEGSYTFIRPVTGKWQTALLNLDSPKDFKVDKNFYVNKQYYSENEMNAK